MEEISDILVKLPVEILTLDSFPNIGEIPETGNTLKKNAFIPNTASPPFHTPSHPPPRRRA